MEYLARLFRKVAVLIDKVNPRGVAVERELRDDVLSIACHVGAIARIVVAPGDGHLRRSGEALVRVRRRTLNVRGIHHARQRERVHHVHRGVGRGNLLLGNGLVIRKLRELDHDFKGRARGNLEHGRLHGARRVLLQQPLDLRCGLARETRGEEHVEVDARVVRRKLARLAGRRVHGRDERHGEDAVHVGRLGDLHRGGRAVGRGLEHVDRGCRVCKRDARRQRDLERVAGDNALGRGIHLIGVCGIEEEGEVELSRIGLGDDGLGRRLLGCGLLVFGRACRRALRAFRVIGGRGLFGIVRGVGLLAGGVLGI